MLPDEESCQSQPDDPVEGVVSQVIEKQQQQQQQQQQRNRLIKINVVSMS